MSNSRSADEVLREHLDLRARAETERDLQRNFASDAVLIRRGHIFRGHEGLRQFASELKGDIGDAKTSYDSVVVDGDVAFLEWSVHSDTALVEDGVDSFVIREGRIVSRTVHYTLRHPPDKHSEKPRHAGRLSPWRESKHIDEKEATEHAARLELRGRSQDEISVRDEYLHLLSVKAGDRVLEVGCGSGVVARALARMVAPHGQVVGADASAAMLEVARGLADEQGLGGLVHFKEADCRSLPFPDQSFDAVLAVTTLSHVPGVERALMEIVRVTRPGGRVGVFDIDGDSSLIAHPDRAVTVSVRRVPS